MTKFVCLFMSMFCLALAIPFGLVSVGCMMVSEFFMDWEKTFKATSEL